MDLDDLDALGNNADDKDQDYEDEVSNLILIKRMSNIIKIEEKLKMV